MKNMIVLNILVLLLTASLADAAWYNVNKGEIDQSTVVSKNNTTTTLVQLSNQVQLFTGNNTQVVTLPDAQVLPLDWFYDFVNLSNGDVTLQDYAGNTLGVVAGQRQSRFLLKGQATAAGAWFQITNSVTGSSAAIGFSDFSATAPLIYNSAGNFSLPLSSASADGYLSSSDWVKFNNSASGNFITDLTGDVTAVGPDSAIATVASIGGKTAAEVVTSVNDTIAATNANTAGAIVRRDGSGDFSVGTVTGVLNGNAATASLFDHTPTQCTGVQVAQGVTDSGAANCITVDGLPAQTGHSGEFLTTDGSIPSWASVPSAGISALTGDVTATGPGSVAATIANNAVTDAKFRQGTARSVVGRSAATGGNVSDIVAGADYQVLQRQGGTLGFTSVDLSQSGAVGTSILARGNGGTGLSAAGTAGNVLTSDGTDWVSAAPSAPAISRSITQTTHGFAVGDIAYYNGTAWAKAKADADSTSEVMGMVTNVPTANTFVLTQTGFVSGLTGLTAGTTYFLSAATAGAITATPPTTPGQVVKPLFVATSTTAGHVKDFPGSIINGSGVSGVTAVAAQVIFDSTCLWSTASGSYADIYDPVCGVTTPVSSGFTSITTPLSGSDKGPGIVFTPVTATGKFQVCYTAQLYDASTGYAQMQAVNSGGTKIGKEMTTYNTSNQSLPETSNCLITTATAGSPTTVKLQIKLSGGSAALIGSGAGDALSFSIVYLGQ